MQAGILLVLGLVLVRGQNEFDACDKDGVSGVCKALKSCSPAITAALDMIPFKLCNNKSKENPIVCCIDTRADDDYDAEDETPTCEPLKRNSTQPRVGQKAWSKCLEYQDKYVYPCKGGLDYSGKGYRAKNCNWKPEIMVVGGENAYRGQFPHMALLGFGAADKKEHWSCGGSIVSKRYILTAGHCTYSKQFGEVTKARIGILNRTEPLESDTIYLIKRVIKHPQYAPPVKYNDLALLEMTEQMKLSRYAVPICLPAGVTITEAKATVTGWGLDAKHQGQAANTLQYVKLEKFEPESCERDYAPKVYSTKYLGRGYNRTSQLCYGHTTEVKDACQGDSGGPLQVKHPNVSCMFVLVGVTSFGGRKCGNVGKPAVYTHVEAYLSWIEGEVWKDEN